MKFWILLGLCLGWSLLCWALFGSGVPVMALALVGCILILWLSESLPAFVPTLLLVAGSLLLPYSGQGDAAAQIFKRMADPVLGLFFCGMCLGLTLRKHGIDQAIAAASWRLSRGSLSYNLRMAMLMTAGLAMWTTNSTAMAITLPAFGGTIQQLMQKNSLQAKGYLVGLAMAANFGGMATPIGTAPNAIAIAALEPIIPIGFGRWMILMLPLAFLLLVISEWMVVKFFRMNEVTIQPDLVKEEENTRLHRGVIALFLGTVFLWLTESVHGLHPLAIGFGAASLAFASGLLKAPDLNEIDWNVLLLIAGGLLLGNLLETQGWMGRTTRALQSSGISQDWQLGLLIVLAAIGSAVSSNTATAIMLVPLAIQLIPEPYAAISVAAACSLGVPFTISTPANALVAGRYEVSNRDMVKVGGPVLLIGSLLMFLSVKWVVGWILL
ncbi:MAG TPA: SLC13 family permease [Oligoflexus sp.]|uniref:SLC13 family permease n=1 Tax=Oligoflexus sp. TaxID=1971216 RepID=UPI002D7FB200|nr:SLC13 family permease [Oligoflexus sp.]HET9237141.1 SLC13 family permease [Oligoflexus sp.]